MMRGPFPARGGRVALVRPRGSFHHEVEHPVFVEFLGGCRMDDPAPRRTRTRSARPSTSGTSLETIRTARPASARRRISAYNSARAPTSTPRVGSSSSRTRQPRSSQRARTTFCWFPPEKCGRARTGLSGLSDRSRVAPRAAPRSRPGRSSRPGRNGTWRRPRHCG